MNLYSPRVGLDGDVDGVDGKTSPAPEEAAKIGQKFATLQIYKSSKQLSHTHQTDSPTLLS